MADDRGVHEDRGKWEYGDLPTRRRWGARPAGVDLERVIRARLPEHAAKRLYAAQPEPGAQGGKDQSELRIPDRNHQMANAGGAADRGRELDRFGPADHSRQFLGSGGPIDADPIDDRAGPQHHQRFEPVSGVRKPDRLSLSSHR